MELRIEPVTHDNFRAVMALTVSPSQCSYIEPNAKSLAEGQYDPQFDWHPFALTRDGTVVGFAMIGAFNASKKYIWLDRFMIDANQQHQGLGAQFLVLLKAFIPAHWPVQDIVLSYSADNLVARQLYLSQGFVLSPLHDGDDPMMVYHIE
ncbi:GNAT family N-acetyltransferase [Oenococcus kitaharae]|uniref:Spermine/spermidine acetyltransferase n=1 Tax=Oenococcus kitaharae DSM 17330 TaxID=1045004 RepID=G9WID1_9LACO|nr:GNAT family N-acetyltransferase [Oenococcus kitaharae]EHN58943.1 spermine/spermidine acetyltransferase [Oenococcus kitaharae DSM 17330]OEY81742.1 hypothetical protein NT96_08190 [Oenococcus kitaharae]OEY83973.1 hypothetical protein NT95_02250 [Oenococcus kitaharae]OEY85671.1 hypothetical protein NV75_04185 [Oenococcus kitaharae]